MTRAGYRETSRACPGCRAPRARLIERAAYRLARGERPPQATSSLDRIVAILTGSAR